MTVQCVSGPWSNLVFVNVFSSSLTLSISVRCISIKAFCLLDAGIGKSEQSYTKPASLIAPSSPPTLLSSLYTSTRIGFSAVPVSHKSERSTLILALHKSITAMSPGWTAWRHTSFSTRRAMLRTLGSSQALTILPSASGTWSQETRYAKLMKRMVRWSASRSFKSTRTELCA